MIYFEHKGSSILRNVRTLEPDNTASHHSLGFAPSIASLLSALYKGMLL